MEKSIWHDDPVLAPLLTAVRADTDAAGLLLSGSRGAGVHHDKSDYDVEWVLTDKAFDLRWERGEPLHMRQLPIDPRLDVTYTCIRELARIAARAGWELPAYTTAIVLYDQNGYLTRVLREMVAMPADRANADVVTWFMPTYMPSIAPSRHGGTEMCWESNYKPVSPSCISYACSLRWSNAGHPITTTFRHS
ncbi:MAG: hypothetical protein GFH27_549301n269 [Chloroflexi bacterium AL-W]|nr:hypothetical protein [Chloroflexi bacterium AL-N1]NOK68463.1 hypothetical protein [Chloroflexi bacterium AL-N10]NOK74109.1 hypothetical protein [Chloroflexi bacterium AL-N5]NOK83076.1 hypothetical protein [Chloroflexi bacterium AL-W]NOK90599.1 hypothetical protein [Chloroflexi bacterium AL-N15]